MPAFANCSTAWYAQLEASISENGLAAYTLTAPNTIQETKLATNFLFIKKTFSHVDITQYHIYLIYLSTYILKLHSSPFISKINLLCLLNIT